MNQPTSNLFFGMTPRDLLRDPTISPASKTIYAILSDYANREDHSAWPSLGTLGSHLGMSNRTAIRRHVDALVDAGWLVREPRAKGDTNRYTVVRGERVRVQPGGGERVRVQGGERVAAQGGERVRVHEVELIEVEPLKENHFLDEAFQNWWHWVPKKVDKADAKKAYTKAIKGTDEQTLLNGIREYADLVAAEERDPRHIKGPAAWLRGKKWEDEIVIPVQRADQTKVMLDAVFAQQEQKQQLKEIER